MSHFTPQEAHEHLRTRTLEAIKDIFPIVGRTHSMHVENLRTDESAAEHGDLQGQYDARIKGESFGVPILGRITVKNNETGKVVSSSDVDLGTLPKMTPRYSYILGGQEYQLDNQWQLKPGVYVRRDRKQNLEAQINSQGKTGMKLHFMPDKKIFRAEVSDHTIPLYPLLAATGVSDAELERTWGKEILDACKNDRNTAGALGRFYTATTGKPPPLDADLHKHLRDQLAGSSVRPESTKLTLGKEYSTLSGDLLRHATGKMLAVYGGEPEDDRDALVFKDLRSAGDFIHDKIRSSKWQIHQKVQRKMNLAGADVPTARGAFKRDMIEKPMHSVFDTSLSRVADQINPVSMLASNFQTTILGPGGIKNEQLVNENAKLISTSHFGFLDPLHTPEGSRVGITLRLPIGVRRVGQQPHIHLYNLKTHKMDLVDPVTAYQSKVVLADQVSWEGGKPRARGETVKMMGAQNIPETGRMSEADYLLPHASQVFGITGNLVPFLGNDSGGRVNMAVRHMEQAISLKNRETPLVRVATGIAGAGQDSFEAMIGKQISHQAPVAGEVTHAGSGKITIKDDAGKHHDVQIYNHFPVNDMKSMLHSTPSVAKGDKVKAGQVIADTNYTKEGHLALGTNVRIAYMPFYGNSFEDGIVVSESAAKKFTSLHLHKHEVPLDETIITDPKKYTIQHATAFKRDQLTHIGDDGVARVGSTVRPGDPLVLAMKPFDLRDQVGKNAVQKALQGSHVDRSLRWDSDVAGKVVAVHRSDKGIQVHVTTEEPLQVGDKLSGRHGNKGICGLVLPDNKMPKTKDGRHVDVILNPIGVAARMNLGQVYEAALGKIVEKTGKPYTVQNFASHRDIHELVTGEMKKHGVSDKEEVFDSDGKPLGNVMVGVKHMIKLVHQVDKKGQERSGMAFPGLATHEGYDKNLQPAGGGHGGGQSLGALGVYSFLAHGAVHQLREAQTWKGEGPDPEGDPRKKWPSQHAQVWAALQTGTALPAPKAPFVFQRFTDMLRASGVNVEKRGHDLVATPLTDAHILEMSGGPKGALAKPHLAVVQKSAKGNSDVQPEKGGIFDPEITGGLGGYKWSHIKLPEPVVNPIFEMPVRALTGLKEKEYEGVCHGKLAISSSGHVVPLGSPGARTGGPGIKSLLDRIDVQKDLATTRRALDTAPASKQDALLKRAKYLRALDEMKMKPSEAYVLHHVPVLPPAMRPLAILPTTGDIKFEDINGLYKTFGQVTGALDSALSGPKLPDAQHSDLRRDMYEGLRSIIGYGVPYEEAKYKGLFHTIAGRSPKEGLFQQGLIQKRQDLSARATIVPEPGMGIDEVGLPRRMALKIFAPFAVRHMVAGGFAKNEMEAKANIGAQLRGENRPGVWEGLRAAMKERPVVLKRDPALHQYSTQAFRAFPIEDKGASAHAIKIHPLVCEGFNADFDGDSCAGDVLIDLAAGLEEHLAPTAPPPAWLAELSQG